MTKEDLSLNAVLAEQGLTTRPASGTYRKDILGPGGEVLFTGDAQAVWDWLRGKCTGKYRTRCACGCVIIWRWRHFPHEARWGRIEYCQGRHHASDLTLWEEWERARSPKDRVAETR